MEEAVETISVNFHLDKDGRIVDVTPADVNGKRSDGDDAQPNPPHACATAIITTKHSPGCFYVWVGRWIRICT